MDLQIFEKMDGPELRKYIEFLLYNYRYMDSFWFIYVSEAFDQATAERLNEQVWERVGERAAKDLRAAFQIEEKGLRGLVKAMRLFPWCILSAYHFQESDEELWITVPSCPPQEARLRRGLGEYDCKEMHRREFESIAGVIDERIRVECLFAPPDPHPEDLFCKWRFYVQSENGGE